MGMLINPYRQAVAAATPTLVDFSYTQNSITPTYMAGIAAGDLLVGIVVCNGVLTNDYSGPSGFTQQAEFGVSSGGVVVVLSMHTKIADGTESGVATFVRNSGAFNAQAAAILHFTGTSGFEGLQTATDTDASVGTPGLQSPQVTTLGASRLLVNIFGVARPNTHVAGGGFTERFDDFANNAGASDYALYVSTASAPTAGAQSQDAPTVTGTTNAGYAMISFAVKP